MTSLTNPAIPKGSIVLVTGINGFLGSHVADQFLQYGYNVRGTVRDVNKSSWLCDLFDGKYGKGRFELLAVPDITVEGAYNEVVKGTLLIQGTPPDLGRLLTSASTCRHICFRPRRCCGWAQSRSEPGHPDRCFGHRERVKGSLL